MRLFIAIDFDEDSYFENLQKQIPSDIARLSLPKSFHLTLKFLGDIKEDKLSRIKELLSQIKFNQFKINVNHLGFFPNENYIRVVWAGLKNNNKVNQIQQEIDQILSIMFGKEKNFHPHITLARVKDVKDKKEFLKKVKNIEVEKKEFFVDKFKLIESSLTSEGALYEDLAFFELDR